jgi:beta-phosphoglucomutase-like phosphatase (HAD superfamily)
MRLFGTLPRNTYVFEDSLHGLQAGVASGATVIGLATTNSREAIVGKAHCVIDDFVGMTFEKMKKIISYGL